MGSRKRVKYTADVIDSMRSDWWMSDDGIDRGPIDSWPAPFLGTDDGSNQVPPRELRRSGTRDGMRFDARTGPVPRVLPNRTFFDDGGLNVEGRRRAMVDAPSIANQRKVDALFSRTGIEGDAYRFLRRQDPGSDLSYAPRRGPLYAQSTPSVMSGAGAFVAYSDTAGAGDLNADISRYHGQLIALYQRWGIWNRIKPQEGQLALAFQQIQQAAHSPSAWKQVGSAHQLAYDLAVKGFGRKPTPAQGAEIENHFRALSQAMPGGGSFLSKVGGALGSVGEGAFSVVKGVGEGAFSVVKSVGNIALSPARLASDIARGKNVLASLSDNVKQNLASVGQIAPYAQAVLSVVPGVGQGVNAAIAAGSALAHGQNITDALVSGVKGMVPGGPLAQQALDTAYNLAKGQSVTDAALAAARGRLPPGPAQMAFDTGLALAHGKNLQQVAKEQGMSFLGDTLQRQLSPVASRALSSVGPRVGNVVNSALSVVPPNVKQAANALLNNPGLRSLPVSDVARRLGIPERDVQHAVASIAQAAQRTGMGRVVRGLAPATRIAERIGNTSFDQALGRWGSRMAPIAMGPNRSAPRVVLPRFPHLMPGAMGLQEAGAFSTIKLGATGEDVKAWQRILGVTPDGKFGAQTDAATRAWQRSHGLVADGVVGPKTWALASGTGPQAPVPSGTVTVPEVVISAAPPPPLSPTQIAAAKSMPTIKLGASGPAVQTWQGILQRDSGISGFPPGPLDGRFGAQTDKATRNWQRSSGLVADGVVGPATWKKAIGSLTTAPLPAEKAPGVPLPTPVPPGLPPGLPPIPTQPISAPPPTIATLPPVMIPLPTAPPMGPPPPTPIGVTTPPPVGPAQGEKAGGAVAALAIGALAAKLFGVF